MAEHRRIPAPTGLEGDPQEAAAPTDLLEAATPAAPEQVSGLPRAVVVLQVVPSPAEVVADPVAAADQAVVEEAAEETSIHQNRIFRSRFISEKWKSG